jgi:hypothetical protein
VGFVDSALSAASHLHEHWIAECSGTGVSFVKLKFRFANVEKPEVMDFHILENWSCGCLLHLFREVGDKSRHELNGFGPVFVAIVDEYCAFWKRYPPKSPPNDCEIDLSESLHEDYQWAWYGQQGVLVESQEESEAENLSTLQTNNNDGADEGKMTRTPLEEYHMNGETDQGHSRFNGSVSLRMRDCLMPLRDFCDLFVGGFLTRSDLEIVVPFWASEKTSGAKWSEESDNSEFRSWMRQRFEENLVGITDL